MAAPFCICLILTGIHVYLGIHVLARGVIFVDLALAQIAALGTTIALMWHLHKDTLPAYLVSLCFTLFGATLFAFTRHVEKRKIPQEAIIGVTYAIASSAIILLLDRASHGAEAIKQMLVGNFLWVTWSEVIFTGILYAVLAVVHYIYRKPLLLVSFDPKGAEKQGYSLKKWDLFFYCTFGLIITSSVKIAGVLLVFSYLVVPSLIGMLLATKIQSRLAIGWSVGFLVSVLGLLCSYFLDLPTGATIVVLFGFFLAATGIAKSLFP